MQKGESNMEDMRENMQQISDGNAQEYLPPRIVLVAKTTKIIRGDQASNYADNTHDFYWSGE